MGETPEPRAHSPCEGAHEGEVLYLTRLDFLHPATYLRHTTTPYETCICVGFRGRPLCLIASDARIEPGLARGDRVSILVNDENVASVRKLPPEV